jgi:hypothetical protein
MTRRVVMVGMRPHQAGVAAKLAEICGVVVVKNIEPLENCTVTIHDVPLEPPVELHAEQIFHSRLDFDLLWGDDDHHHGQQWSISLRSAAEVMTITAEELHKMNVVMRERTDFKPKNHPQPCNPKSFKRKTNR